MKQLLKTLARRTPLYPVYRRLADRYKTRRLIRQFWKWSSEDLTRLGFYQQFIPTGALVFDVGANMGNRAKVFSKLGAVVVAVEPQTSCADFLVCVFQKTPNFHLIRKALGASVGQAEMLVSDAHVISSLSPDWVRTVTASGRFAECHRGWNRKETVLIDTLDNLIRQYGPPAFVKIDVEGFEDQVVSGLSTPVGALSVEFTPEFMESTFRCIEHLCRIGDPRFQISVGESMEFSLHEWVTAEEVRKALSEVSLTTFGDLYVRFNGNTGKGK